MKPNSTALAVSLLSSVLLLNAQAATAQTTSPPSTTATRPATTPPGKPRFQTKARRPRQPRPPVKPVAIPWSRK